jgi:hypothetical protein
MHTVLFALSRMHAFLFALVAANTPLAPTRLNR